jgi:aminoglycoside phosphotransferase family enzyme/predicted kinase
LEPGGRWGSVVGMTPLGSAPDDALRIAETHISWVFFAPDRAYKVLKPVTMPFFDHTDRVARIEAAAREYELNHAISPDVYLGTADVVEEGELVDRMVVMRRLPADRRLSALVDDPAFRDHLRATARVVAALHASRPPVAEAPGASAEALAGDWRENFEAIAPYAGTVVDREEFDRVERLVDAYLGRRAELFDRRLAEGFVRDVHGDLIADDIFVLDDGPRMIDCLAFNDEWRVIDVLSDIGFLIMDVHRLAGVEAAEQLMRWYQEYSNEHHPPSLAHHYVAYRAHVRAKVACFRVGQGHRESAELAATYHRLAAHHLERARLRVILVGGGPGAGKSTLAERLGAHFGYPTLVTDEIRKDLTGTPHDEHRFAAPGEGIYSPEITDRAYVEQRREAELLLRAGNGVVLDASWSSERHRRAVRELARDCGVELVEIECTLDPALARERIARRLSNPHNPSDATPDLVDFMAARRDGWPEAIPIATDGRIEQVTARAVDEIARQSVRVY